MSWEHGLGWFFAVMLGGVALGFFTGAWDKYRLNARGRWIEAEIIRVDEDKDTDGDPRFYPVVAFTPPDGEPVEVRSLLGKPYPPERDSNAGSKVNVRYDPAKPTRIELPGYKGDGALTNLMIGLAVAGAAVAFAAGMLR